MADGLQITLLVSLGHTSSWPTGETPTDWREPQAEAELPGGSRTLLINGLRYSLGFALGADGDDGGGSRKIGQNRLIMRMFRYRPSQRR